MPGGRGRGVGFVIKVYIVAVTSVRQTPRDLSLGGGGCDEIIKLVCVCFILLGSPGLSPEVLSF